MGLLRRMLMITSKVNEGSGNYISYPGLIAAWSAEGKSNQDSNKAVLRDLTGNGHSIILSGFSFNEEGSGYGHPDYPEALVFDGIKDYGINENMPILEDFTLIIKTKVINRSGTNAIITKDRANTSAAFNLRHDKVYLYGKENKISYPESEIVYLTPNLYNGQSIEKGSGSDVDVLNLGCIRYGQYLCNMAFYYAYLFNRSLEEQEIKSFIREYIDAEYLLPNEQ